LDFVFLVDNTGSMGKPIKSVVNSSFKILDSLRNKTNNWRAAVVTYNDPGSAIITTFNRDKQKIKRVMQSIRAFGGRDEPELLYHGTETAINKLKWRKDALKIIVAFTDATSKPVHKRNRDIQLLKDNEIIFFGVALPMYGRKPRGTRHLKELSDGSGGVTIESVDASKGILDIIKKRLVPVCNDNF